MNWKEQEQYLASEFGTGSAKPKNDLDRPMNVEELKKFSQHSTVCIGNHTHNHLNLTIYSEREITESLSTAAQFLENTIQKPVRSVAYPYGLFNDIVVEASKKTNHKIGVTCETGKVKPGDISNTDLLRLKRNQLSGYYDIETQCRNFDYNFSLVASLKQIPGKMNSSKSHDRS